MTASVRCVCLVLFASLGLPAAAQDKCTTNQWVRPTEEGRLTGEVVLPDGSNQSKAVGRAELALVNSRGEVLTGRTNSKGRFTIREVEPGIYSMAVASDGFFGALAVHVIAADQTDADAYPTRLTVSVTELDVDTVDGAMSRYLSGSNSIRPAIDTFSDIDYAAIGEFVCSDDAYRILQTDEGMKGRIFMKGVANNKLQNATQTNVMIFRDGEQVARTTTDDAGVFEIEELVPGAYGLMAAGADGFAVVGFELLSDDPTSDSDRFSGLTSDSATLVTQAVGPSATFGVQLSDAAGAQQAARTATSSETETVLNEEVATTPSTPMAGLNTPQGTYVGGGLSGGGGFAAGGGGGSGLGGIAGLAGVGAVIAATAGDDDNNFNRAVPPAASPSVPTP